MWCMWDGMCVCLYISLFIYVCGVYMCVYVCVGVCIYVCCVYVCVFLCVSVCVLLCIKPMTMCILGKQSTELHSFGFCSFILAEDDCASLVAFHGSSYSQPQWSVRVAGVAAEDLRGGQVLLRACGVYQLSSSSWHSCCQLCYTQGTLGVSKLSPMHSQ